MREQDREALKKLQDGFCKQAKGEEGDWAIINAILCPGGTVIDITATKIEHYGCLRKLAEEVMFIHDVTCCFIGLMAANVTDEAREAVISKRKIVGVDAADDLETIKKLSQEMGVIVYYRKKSDGQDEEICGYSKLLNQEGDWESGDSMRSFATTLLDAIGHRTNLNKKGCSGAKRAIDEIMELPSS